MRLNLLVLLTLVFALSLGTGCVVVTDDFSCFSDSECFVGELCDGDGFCVDDCVFSGCAFAEDVCDVPTGQCIAPLACGDDLDCPVTDFCGVDGFCYEYLQSCVGSSDCVGDGICDGGVCDLDYLCIDNTDCPWIGSSCNLFGRCEYDI